MKKIFLLVLIAIYANAEPIYLECLGKRNDQTEVKFTLSIDPEKSQVTYKDEERIENVDGIFSIDTINFKNTKRFRTGEILVIDFYELNRETLKVKRGSSFPSNGDSLNSATLYDYGYCRIFEKPKNNKI